MALGYDTKNTTGPTTNNPVVFAYTCGATAKLLVVLIIGETTTARTGGTPTYNGVDMSQAGTAQAGSAECNVELWYLYNPTTGSAQDISIPNSGALNLRVMAASYTGTGAELFGTPQQTGTSSASPSLTINNVPAGGMCVSVLGHGYKNAPTGRSHTTLYETDHGAYSSNGQYGLIASLSNVTMSWTIDGSDDVAMIMAAFKEVAAVTPKALAASFTPGAGAATKFPQKVAAAEFVPAATIIKKSFVSKLATLLYNYWPPGSAAPAHLWPFDMTDNYADKGTDPTCNLTEGGSGNTFNSGLVFNGSGFASCGVDADFALGTVWSILIKFRTGNDITSATQGLVGYGFPSADENGWFFFTNTAGDLYGQLNTTSSSFFATLATNTEYTFILTYDGTTLRNYLNGVEGTPWEGSINLQDHATQGVYVGRRCDGAYYFTGAIRRIAVLKGYAWSGQEAASIYAAITGGREFSSDHEDMPGYNVVPQFDHYWNFAGDFTDTEKSGKDDLSLTEYNPGQGYYSWVNDWAGRASQALQTTGGYNALYHTNHADVSNLGSVFSILIEFKTGTSVSGYDTLFDNGYPNGTGLYIINSLGNFAVYVGGGGGGCLYNTVFALTANTYYQVVLTLDASGYYRFYINGSFYGSDNTVSAPPSSSSTFYFGLRTDLAWELSNGWQLCRAGVLKGTALTATQIQNLYDTWVACGGGIWKRRCANVETSSSIMTTLTSSFMFLELLTAGLSYVGAAGTKALKSLSSTICFIYGFWPTGVTLPQHYWPFREVGNYSDQGSTGGLDLTAGGSGNSFGADGLILNGSGWAERSNNADLCNIGNTFSIMIQLSLDPWTSSWEMGLAGYDGSNGWYLIFENLAAVNLVTFVSRSGGDNSYAFTKASFPGVSFAAGIMYQIIVVSDGGQLSVYCNGVPSSSNPMSIVTPGSSTGSFYVGSGTGGGSFLLPGTIRRVGVLKGTAWSASDVSALYNFVYSTWTLQRGIFHYLAGALSSTGSLFKKAAKVLVATLSTSGLLSSVKTLVIELVAGLVTSGTAAAKALKSLTARLISFKEAAWPTGIAKPQHYWPFKETKNYTDQGDTGGLDLTAQGTGNNFGPHGLELNGSGWANGANNADVCSLGATFSILAEIIADTDTAKYVLYSTYSGDPTGWDLSITPTRRMQFVTWNPSGTFNKNISATDTVPKNVLVQIAIVHSGGYTTLYVNGVEIKAATAQADPLDFTSYPFAIGAASYLGTTPMVGIISRIGVLKGTAWTPAEVLSIFRATHEITALPRKPYRALLGVFSSTGTTFKKKLQALVGSLTSSGVLSTLKMFVATLAGSLSASGAVTRKSLKVLAATVTSTGTITRKGIKSLVAGLSSIAELITQLVGGVIQKPLAASIAFIGATANKTTKTFSAIYSAIGTRIAKALKPLVASVSSSGVLYKQVGKVLKSTASFVGIIVRLAKSVVRGTLNSAGAISRKTIRAVVGTINFIGTLASLKAFFTTLLASIQFTGRSVPRAAKVLVSALNSSGRATKRVGRGLVAGLSFIGSAARKIPAALSAAISFIGEVITAGNVVILTASMAFIGTAVKKSTKSLTALLLSTFNYKYGDGNIYGTGKVYSLLEIGSLRWCWSRVLAALITFGGMLRFRLMGRVLAASLTFIGTLPRPVFSLLLSAVVNTSATCQKLVGKVLRSSSCLVGELSSFFDLVFHKTLDASMVLYNGVVFSKTILSFSGVLTSVGSFVKSVVWGKALSGWFSSIARALWLPSKRLEARANFGGSLSFVTDITRHVIFAAVEASRVVEATEETTVVRGPNIVEAIEGYRRKTDGEVS